MLWIAGGIGLFFLLLLWSANGLREPGYVPLRDEEPCDGSFCNGTCSNYRRRHDGTNS